MRKNVFLLICFTIFIYSCSNEKNEPIKNNYFNEPIIDWTLTKDNVKLKEQRTLIADRSPDYYTITSIFESTGTGGLEYAGENSKISSVQYFFFCNAGTLVQSEVIFVSNSTIATDLAEFAKKKYGDIYTEVANGNDLKLTWDKGNMLISYVKAGTNLYMMYRKNPLK